MTVCGARSDETQLEAPDWYLPSPRGLKVFTCVRPYGHLYMHVSGPYRQPDEARFCWTDCDRWDLLSIRGREPSETSSRPG